MAIDSGAWADALMTPEPLLPFAISSMCWVAGLRLAGALIAKRIRLY
jgi:hypothetical protein